MLLRNLTLTLLAATALSACTLAPETVRPALPVANAWPIAASICLIIRSAMRLRISLLRSSIFSRISALRSSIVVDARRPVAFPVPASRAPVTPACARASTGESKSAPSTTLPTMCSLFMCCKY